MSSSIGRILYCTSLALFSFLFFSFSSSVLEFSCGRAEGSVLRGKTPVMGHGLGLIDWEEEYKVLCAQLIKIVIHDVNMLKAKNLLIGYTQTPLPPRDYKTASL